MAQQQAFINKGMWRQQNWCAHIKIKEGEYTYRMSVQSGDERRDSVQP